MSRSHDGTMAAKEQVMNFGSVTAHARASGLSFESIHILIHEYIYLEVTEYRVEQVKVLEILKTCAAPAQSAPSP